MIRKIIKAIRRAKATAYARSLHKQLARLEDRLEDADGPERFELQRRVNRKRLAIDRAASTLAALGLALMLAASGGCAHGFATADAIEAAVIASETALEVCRRKHTGDEWNSSQSAQDARARCLRVHSIERTRDATTALDDAVEAMAIWISTGTQRAGE